MKLKPRFDGTLKMSQNPAADDSVRVGISQPVRKGQVIEVKTETARMCSESLWAYVKAGKLIPVDTEAKAFFEKTK